MLVALRSGPQLELALDDVERVGRDARMKRRVARQLRDCNLAQECASCFEQLGDSWWILHVSIFLPWRSLRSWRENSQQIQLTLRRPTRNQRSLYALVSAAAQPLRHVCAHDSPAQAAEHVPPLQPGCIDRPPARALVRSEQILAPPEAANRIVQLAEAPRWNAHPREIFCGIADVRELPVEDRVHALRTDDQITVAIVAMNERRCDGGRHVLAQPAEREIENGSRSFLRLILRVQMLQLSLGIE